MTRLTLCLGLAFSLFGGEQILAEAATRVFINGKPSPVHFNDGDSFRVLAGPLNKSRARLAGFNTLESYGAVHQWGDWTAKELYFLAKMGTLNGRQGVWHCTADMSRDGYGRLLLDCPDLVEDQVRTGFAHAMTITPEGAPANVMAIQHEAMAAKRGIWAHGVPEYILTSTHSSAEQFGAGKSPYNRLVSTVDGHSKKWVHNTKYKECDNVCYMPVKLDPAKVLEAAQSLKTGDLADELSDVPVDVLAAEITDFLDRTGLWTKDVIPKKLWTPLALKVDELREAGVLGENDPANSSCMLYVDYRRRWGTQRAACLD